MPFGAVVGFQIFAGKTETGIERPAVSSCRRWKMVFGGCAPLTPAATRHKSKAMQGRA